MLLFAAVFVAIRFPAVQTKLAKQVAAYLSESVGHEVTIGRVDIAFFSSVILEQVKVLDNRKNEMLYIGKAEADIDAFSIFDPNTLLLNTLKLNQPRVNLTVNEGTDTLNLNHFLNKLGDLFVKDTTKPERAPFKFSLNKLIVKDGRFVYDDFNAPRTDYGMDYSHLTFEGVSGSFSELQFGDTLKVRVAGLRTTETRSSTLLHNLDTRMTYADTFWEWADLDLQINNSNLQHFVRFDYSRIGNFGNFIDSVTMTGTLENSRLYSKDIATFAPQLKEYNENLTVNSLTLKGKVKDFTATNVDLAYGQNTHIVGSINADGLPNFEETFANLRLKSSTINAHDLKQFLPQDTYAMVARLGTVSLEGRFLGFYNDFVANGKFNTALGNVQSDINLKIDDRTRASSYNGYVNTDGFNLGKLLDIEDQVKRISMSGRLEGSGFTLKDANVKLDATVKQVQLLDYNYQNIKANGTLKQQVFVGKVSIDDPNLIFDADGEVNLAEGRRAFNMAANLQRVDLQAMKLSTAPFVVSGKANFDFEGLSLNTFEGTASFDSAYVVYRGKELAIDSMLIQSEIAPDNRSLYLTSDILALRVNGNFDYTTLIADLGELVEEYKLNFESNEAATTAYYARKPKGGVDEYAVSYDIYLKHINPLLDLFMPELRISDFSKAEGSFRHGSTVILAM